jgi:hypothetical protein
MDRDMVPYEFESEVPTMAPEIQRAGERVLDEGTYVCTACNAPGNEVSLLPGDILPDCTLCGSDARWTKV